MPIYLWDESRQANNALEMVASGLSLVTTYNGVPDHWNARPPLLVWVIAATMQLLGTNEWAVRLPSVLAALATGVVMFAFLALHLRRPFAGFAAAMVLFGASGYMLQHGARAGDHEAMLTLWTTCYGIAAYLHLYGSRERRGLWLSLTALCVMLAYLTKSVLGLVFLPAIVLHALLHRRLWESLRSPGLYIHVALVLFVCVAYYVAREAQDPGFVAEVLYRDFGRYSNLIVYEKARPATYFVAAFNRFYWLIPGLVMAAWIAWRGDGEPRRVCSFLGLLAFFYLIVISTSRTKFPWYDIPLYPVIAMVVGIALDLLVSGFARRAGRSATPGRVVIALALVALIGRMVGLTFPRMSESAKASELVQYNLFLRDHVAHRAGERSILVVHPGYDAEEFGYYVAPTLFYVQVLRREGRTVEIQAPLAPISSEFTSLVACGETARELHRRIAVPEHHAELSHLSPVPSRGSR